MISRKWLSFSGLLLALIIMSALIGAIGCQSAPAPTSTPPPAATAAAVSFSKDIQPLLSSNCGACHQGANAPARLSLEPGSAYQNLANVKATESSLMRVAPGAPDKSYLVNKLLGTQGQAGGTGAQMPLNGSPLAQAQISLIQQWITDGAPNN